MKIKGNDRILIAGKTGSGKTWLAERLTASIPRLVVIDYKATLGSWSIVEPKRGSWKKFSEGDPGRFRILPPIVDDPSEWYENLFERLYQFGNLTLYIDEAYSVAPIGARPGKWLSALYTRGRERGIGVWAATQRPAWIPLFLLSEADWIIQFRLNLDVDRKRMASIAGENVIGRIPDVHGFWLYDVKDEFPKYFETAVQADRTGV